MRESTTATTAFEMIGNPEGRGRLLVSCEHASNRVPLPLVINGQDQPWLEKHWGWDIGAAIVARYLVNHSDSIGVFSTFSRLVIDPNRELESDTLIPLNVEGYELSFNRGLDDKEQERRIATLYEPYHRAFDEMVGDSARRGQDMLLVSVHSFTPSFNGERREMEIGVLFDDFEELAISLAGKLEAQGLVTALNEPYSGKLHMMPAAHRHGRAHGVTYLEIEIRQDLIDTEAKAEAIGARLLEAVSGVLHFI